LNARFRLGPAGEGYFVSHHLQERKNIRGYGKIEELAFKIINIDVTSKLMNF